MKGNEKLSTNYSRVNRRGGGRGTLDRVLSGRLSNNEDRPSSQTSINKQVTNLPSPYSFGQQ
jgi:hypothetical protein